MNDYIYEPACLYAVRRSGTIVHTGVPGMKWGNRRYQYADGTWTELGKERRRAGSATQMLPRSGVASANATYAAKRSRTERRRAMIDTAITPSIKGGKDKPSVSPMQQIVKETQNINTNISDINTTRRERAVRVDATAKTMTDEELKASIARMNLEHQYSRLKADEVSAGYMFLQDALDIMGSTLGVIGSTIVIAGAVNKILKAGG